MADILNFPKVKVDLSDVENVRKHVNGMMRQSFLELGIDIQEVIEDVMLTYEKEFIPWHNSLIFHSELPIEQIEGISLEQRNQILDAFKISHKKVADQIRLRLPELAFMFIGKCVLSELLKRQLNKYENSD